MIHSHVEIVDLDPLTWRHLGEIFPIAEWGELRRRMPGVLTILHQNGKVLRSDLPSGVPANAIPTHVDNSQSLARRLYETFPGLTRIQIFEKNSLRAFSDRVQRLDWSVLNSADFYRAAWELAQSDPQGLCYYPAGLPRLQVLEQLRGIVEATPDGEHLVLGVYDDGQPYFSLIARVDNQQVTLLTTFDALVKYGVDTQRIPASPDDEQTILPLIEQHFGKVAQSLFCDRSTLMQLIQHYQKLETP